VEDTEEARLNSEKYPRPLHIIEGPLMTVRIPCLLLLSLLKYRVTQFPAIFSENLMMLF